MVFEDACTGCIPLVDAVEDGEILDALLPPVFWLGVDPGGDLAYRMTLVGELDGVECGQTVTQLAAGLSESETAERVGLCEEGAHDCTGEAVWISPEGCVGPVRVYDHIVHCVTEEADGETVLVERVGAGHGGAGEECERAMRVGWEYESLERVVSGDGFQRMGSTDVEVCALGLLAGVAVYEHGAMVACAERVGECAGGEAFAESTGTACDEHERGFHMHNSPYASHAHSRGCEYDGHIPWSMRKDKRI